MPTMIGAGSRTTRRARVGWLLVLASHPLPTIAVTGISAGLAALAGAGAGTAALVTLAVFTGQLSIGWSNDRIDAARDRASSRADKPLATGELAVPVVTAAIVGALAATIGFSLALGYRAGLVALLTVACGWAYNGWLKATVFSWLAFAVAFGLLPAIATLALPAHHWPAAWAITAGALLGTSAHFANVLPDLRSDEATGVRGLPHRLGATATAVIGPLLLVGATAAVVLAGATRLGGWRWVALGASAVVALAAIAAGRVRPSSRWYFIGTVLIAVADLALFGLSGGRLR